MLCASRRPVKSLTELTDQETADIFIVAKKVQRMIESHYGVTSATVVVQDGPDAGQTVAVMHICYLIFYFSSPYFCTFSHFILSRRLTLISEILCLQCSRIFWKNQKCNFNHLTFLIARSRSHYSTEGNGFRRASGQNIRGATGARIQEGAASVTGYGRGGGRLSAENLSERCLGEEEAFAP